MRKGWPWIASAIGLVFLIGCESTAPERREVLGTWFGEAPNASMQMTLTEVGRSVDGVGSWLEAGDAFAFRVLGAVIGDEVSLLLEFGRRPNVNFNGTFVGYDVLEGTLTGGEYRRSPVTLHRDRR